ncbi:MAG: hypothetical protein J6S28_02205 [Clostridia bacterium]|nr:hypothetical protein [Clostridia bacterium]
MNSQGSKIKVYCSTALILSATGLLLYCLSYLLAKDGSDYFVSGHPIPLLANALAIAAVIWFASALILIPKNTLGTKDFMQGKRCITAILPLLGTLNAGAMVISYFTPDDLVALLSRERPLDATALCSGLAVLGTVLSVAFYALRTANAPGLASVTVVMGIGPVAMLTGLCGLTYFEQDHHMNAPAKIALQLAFIATMLYLTAELRYTLDRAQPRRFLTSSCIAIFANACALAGALPAITDPAGTVHGTRILALALLCLCNGIYIAHRLVTFCKSCNLPDPTELTQEKEIQDGCQQQDPMATQEDN